MLGEELKRQREALGLSLSQISEKTRIPSRFLKAIEDENYSILPEGLYTRSFIRTFAKQVGMSEDVALDLYQKQTGQGETLADPAVVFDDEPFVYAEPSRSLLPAALVALGLAVLISAIAFGIWQYSKRADTPPPVQTTQQPPPKPVDPAPPSNPTPADNPADGKLRVTLQASSQCWISFSTDDGKRTQLMLNEGDLQQIHASESIYLSIGNTQAVSMRINGRDAHFPPSPGTVLKKLVITPETVESLTSGPTTQ